MSRGLVRLPLWSPQIDSLPTDSGLRVPHLILVFPIGGGAVIGCREAIRRVQSVLTTDNHGYRGLDKLAARDGAISFSMAAGVLLNAMGGSGAEPGLWPCGDVRRLALAETHTQPHVRRVAVSLTGCQFAGSPRPALGSKRRGISRLHVVGSPVHPAYLPGGLDDFEAAQEPVARRSGDRRRRVPPGPGRDWLWVGAGGPRRFRTGAARKTGEGGDPRKMDEHHAAVAFDDAWPRTSTERRSQTRHSSFRFRCEVVVKIGAVR